MDHDRIVAKLVERCKGLIESIVPAPDLHDDDHHSKHLYAFAHL
jgi:hypothetical protein